LTRFRLCTISLYLFLFIGCHKTPHVIVGRSYFFENNIQRSGADRLEAPASHAVVEASGVFGTYFYAVKSYPALLSIDPQNHLTYVLLHDSLNALLGDFITVSGVVVDSSLKVGATARTVKSMLKVQHVSIIKPSHKFLTAAQRDYEKYWAALSGRGPKNSRLVWPASPDWRLLVNDGTQQAVVFFSAADLMYALEVNFVYNMNNEKLDKVYVDERFKGE